MERLIPRRMLRCVTTVSSARSIQVRSLTITSVPPSHTPANQETTVSSLCRILARQEPGSPCTVLMMFPTACKCQLVTTQIHKEQVASSITSVSLVSSAQRTPPTRRETGALPRASDSTRWLKHKKTVAPVHRATIAHLRQRSL